VFKKGGVEVYITEMMNTGFIFFENHKHSLNFSGQTYEQFQQLVPQIQVMCIRP
jgi:hypothetical protein